MISAMTSSGACRAASYKEGTEAGMTTGQRNAGLLAMAFVAMAQFGNFYVYDSIGPVADLLQSRLGFSDTQLGTLNAIYSLPNVVLILVGGILVDRLGAGKTMLWTAGICSSGPCSRRPVRAST
jgi:nitrate/nitrite transporter NarK